MNDERSIQQCAKDLLIEYGREASVVAERKMLDLMRKNEVKEAGLWLAVLHELNRTDSRQIH